MKINEKTLVKYATSNSTQPEQEGFLFKRGEVNRSFQRRWCVLKGNLFYYFEKKPDREPIGCIILEGCRIEVAEHETDMFAFKIAFVGPSARTYIFGTDTQENMESWMRALSCASYDYLRAVVSELQKQLDEINETEKRKMMQAAAGGGRGVATPRVNPFDGECNDLIDLGPGAKSKQPILFTQRPFAEIHESYARKFATYFEAQRAKHNQSNSNQSGASELLLDLLG